MPDEKSEKSGGIDDLFPDSSSSPESQDQADALGELLSESETQVDSPPPAAASQATQEGYLCSRCGETYPSTQEIKFCSKCGAPVNVAQSSASKRVLLVDDSQLARKKIAAILKKLGCQVSEAEDGKEGVIAAIKSKPHLIILDIQMPNVNGLDALKTLRKNPLFDSTPILMMTVEADAQVVAQALAAKANDYIRKDSSVAELISRLRKHVSRLG